MADTTFSPGTIITSDWLNDVNDAIYGSGGAVNANTVVVTPAGTVSSVNVQAALEELDGDIQTKAASTHNHTGTYEPVITTLSIAKGGTGQATATAAFDALAPTTTAGDMIYHNGTDNVRLAKGTAGQVLTMNSGATAPEWATNSTGVKGWILFDGSSGTEAASSNMGVSKSSTGTYSVTFDTALASANYAVMVQNNPTDTTTAVFSNVSSKTVNGFTLTTNRHGAGLYDSSSVQVVVIG